jgi:hypothetical protein
MNRLSLIEGPKALPRRPLGRGILIMVLVCGGCAGGGLPPVIDPADVAPQAGAPRITAIRDAGTVNLPRTGAIDAITDGVASPGELLVIEGKGFGRQPTVLVGQRGADVLARTRGDGIVVRVPAGVETGLVDVTVSTSEGKARLGVEIHRLGVVLSHRRLRFVAIGQDGIVPTAHELAIEGARPVRLDGTGGGALVLTDARGGSGLAIVDLGRKEPIVLGTLPLAHRGEALATAAAVPRAAVIGEGKLTLVETSSLRRPILYQTVTLPKEARGIIGAELSPDGRVLALLVGEGNRLVAFDVSSPAAPALISSVELLPGEKLNLVRDLAFAPDGQTLWVVSGPSADTHPQVVPTRITAVRLLAAFAEGGAPSAPSVSLPAPTAPRAIPTTPIRRMLAVWKTQTVTGAAAPLSLSVGSAPDAQGSLIRDTPETATVYVTAMKDALLELKGGKVDAARLRKLLGPPNAGMIARAELGSGGGPVATTREVLGQVALPPGRRQAVALAIRATDAGFELGVASVSLDGQAKVGFVTHSPTIHRSCSAISRSSPDRAPARSRRVSDGKIRLSLTRTRAM